MRAYKFLAITAVIMLMGAGCIFDRTPKDFANKAGELVALHQGAPPEDCGRRNPKRMQPYFTITNLQKVDTFQDAYYILQGEPIDIDASCTVGRIKELHWDFEFEAWPEATPPEQRFEVPIIINHWDLENPDYDNGEYDLNNTPEFFQKYIPTQTGKLTARLKTVDHRGRTQTVISQYIVRPRPRYAGDNVRANFYLQSNGSVFPQGTAEKPVKIPLSIESRAFGTSAVILGDIGRAVIFEWLGVDKPGFNTVVNPQRQNLLQDGFVGDTGQLGAPNSFGLKPMQVKRNIKDFKVTLTERSPAGASDNFEQHLQAVDFSEIAEIIPQFTILPVTKKELTITYGANTPRYPEKIQVEYGQRLLFSNTSIVPLPDSIRTESGSRDQLQNWRDLWNGEIFVAFDKGDGIFEQASHIVATDVVRDQVRLSDDTYDPPYVFQYMIDFWNGLFVSKDYAIDFSPGNYVARMKISSIRTLATGRVVEEKIVEIPYEVISPRNGLETKIVASSDTIRAGEQVVFDGSQSKNNLHLYDWKITNAATGAIVHEVKSIEGQYISAEINRNPEPFIVEPKIYDLFVYRFRFPGTYKVEMTTYSDPDRTVGKAEVVITVREREQAFAGTLPDINPEIFPAGVARVGGLSDQPSYVNDRIIFSIPTLDATASKVEWDFESDGTMDVSCDVQVLDGGYITCNRITKEPPHQTVGEVTATLFVSEKNGQGRQRQNKSYYIIEENRVLKDQVGRVLR